MVSLPPYLRRGGCAPRPRSRSTAGQDRARTRGWYRAGAAPPGPSPLSSARAAHPTVTAGTIPKNTRAPTGMRARQGNSAAARASPRSDQKPTGSSAGEQNGAHSGTARPGYSRSPAQPAPGDPRAPHPGTAPGPAERWNAHTAPRALRDSQPCPGAAPSPGPPAAFTCGESSGRAGSARRRLPGRGETPEQPRSLRGRPRLASPQRRSAAHPPRDAGRRAARRGRSRPGAPSRAVPCPGSAAAATASEGRARRARRQLPPPPHGHRRAARRGSRSAPSSRPPRAAAALSRRQPPRVGGGFFLPPFPLSAHSSGSFLLPRSLPSAATRAVSWTALPGSANRCRVPSPALPAEVRSAEPPARPRVADADLGHSAAPGRGRRGAGDPLRPLPARGSGTAHPSATAGLEGRNPPGSRSAESFPAGWKGTMGSAASTSAGVEPGLRHRRSGTGQHLHPHTKMVPTQQRSLKPLLKCFWLRSHGWPVARSIWRGWLDNTRSKNHPQEPLSSKPGSNCPVNWSDSALLIPVCVVPKWEKLSKSYANIICLDTQI